MFSPDTGQLGTDSFLHQEIKQEPEEDNIDLYYYDFLNINQSAATSSTFPTIARKYMPNKEGLTFKCLDCGRSHKKFYSLASHLRLHVGERVFTCDTCHKEFECQSALREHLQKNRCFVRQYECAVCNVKFRNLAGLNQHFKSNKSHDIMKRFVCNICDKGFSRSFDLKTHMRVHSGELPFQCELCGKSFRAATNLNKHRKRHRNVYGKITDTTKYMFKCDECGKGFDKMSSLQNHKRTHDRPEYQCELCDFKTKKSDVLKRHRYVHGGVEVPTFDCHICSYKTNKKGNLQKHVLTHTGIKPYSCDICFVSYADRSNLNKHYLTKHSKLQLPVIV